jgi:hypothetical protein
LGYELSSGLHAKPPEPSFAIRIPHIDLFLPDRWGYMRNTGGWELDEHLELETHEGLLGVSPKPPAAVVLTYGAHVSVPAQHTAISRPS